MKVAVIGANGQVGREVCLFLSAMGTGVIAVSRTEFGGIFLERCGIACRYGVIGDPRQAARLLEGCDIVADFSHPQGLPAEVRPAVKRNIENIARWAEKGATYIYMSTISAFGMLSADSRMKNYILPHTRYAADKRYLERLALGAGKQRPVYVLRLGQVHGELQKSSQEFMEEAAPGVITLPFSSDTPSYTVFCFSIAEAIINISLGKEHPGRYTMVSTPAWTWQEVYSYWARRLNPALKLRIIQRQSVGSRGSRSQPGLLHYLAGAVFRFGFKHRELLMNYFSLGSFKIQDWMRAEYLRHKAATEISCKNLQPFAERKFWVGDVPGDRLKSISDSRFTMEETTQVVRDMVSWAVERG